MPLGLGAGSRAQKWECRIQAAHPTTQPCPARASCPCCAGPIPEETEQHPPASEMRPVPTGLPASTNRRGSLEEILTLWLFVCFCSRILGGKRKASRPHQGAKNISEVSSTTSKRAGELTAWLRPVLTDKRNCLLNPGTHSGLSVVTKSKGSQSTGATRAGGRGRGDFMHSASTSRRSSQIKQLTMHKAHSR